MLWLMLSTGCGDHSDTPTYYADVAPILDAYCGECHGDGGVGPFAFDSAESAIENAALIRWAAESGSMPPWGAAPLAGYPLRYDVSLSAEQVATLVAWEEAGAPAGDPDERGSSLDLDVAQLERTDMTVELPAPYTPSAVNPDDYRCFAIEWPEAELSWVTAFRGVPDFDPVVHHMLAFVISPTDTDTVRDFDAFAEGPGYPCFGFVNPSDRPDTDFVNARLLGQWAPGTGAVRMGSGAGLVVEPGSMIVLQMHYSTVGEVLPDQSALDVELTRTPPDAEAFAVVWTNFGWFVGIEPMTIPAGEERVQHAFEQTFVGSPNVLVAGVDGELDGGASIRSILPHMHRLGQSITVTLDRADGPTEAILSVPAWDFDWQRQYAFVDPVVVEPGDRLRVRCTWSNTREFRTSRGASPDPIDVGWGDGTSDEMCAALVNVTAR
ncbi:MAG: monooxygenase [Myxococcales bacterium]|nr:monooxygenase [Myxococcales bacterium]